jgi:hypothetical protein
MCIEDRPIGRVERMCTGFSLANSPPQTSTVPPGWSTPGRRRTAAPGDGPEHAAGSGPGAARLGPADVPGVSWLVFARRGAS